MPWPTGGYSSPGARPPCLCSGLPAGQSAGAIKRQKKGRALSLPFLYAAHFSIRHIDAALQDAPGRSDDSRALQAIPLGLQHQRKHAAQVPDAKLLLLRPCSKGFLHGCAWDFRRCPKGDGRGDGKSSVQLPHAETPRQNIHLLRLNGRSIQRAAILCPLHQNYIGNSGGEALCILPALHKATALRSLARALPSAFLRAQHSRQSQFPPCP